MNRTIALEQPRIIAEWARKAADTIQRLPERIEVLSVDCDTKIARVLVVDGNTETSTKPDALIAYAEIAGLEYHIEKTDHGWTYDQLIVTDENGVIIKQCIRKER